MQMVWFSEIPVEGVLYLTPQIKIMSSFLCGALTNYLLAYSQLYRLNQAFASIQDL